jgi:branched-chain amino acid transport system ATP-binding protein
MSFFHDVLGTTPGVFLGITLVFMGSCAFMTGQALASTWRPIWQAVPYALLLACADRFLTFALFGGRLLSGVGYLVDAAILAVIALAAYRARRARQMAVQYPWLYERSGLFSWRERIHTEP